MDNKKDIIEYYYKYNKKNIISHNEDIDHYKDAILNVKIETKNEKLKKLQYESLEGCH